MPPQTAYKTFTTDIDNTTSPPSVSACNVVDVSYSSARLEARIVSRGVPELHEKGFCYGTAQEPVMDDGNSVCVPVYGAGEWFGVQITGLEGNTTYNVRAYAANTARPVQYGSVTGFKTQGGDGVIGFEDTRDGQIYKYAQIGRFVWMTQNLNYATEDSWCYDDDESNCEKYGRLYTWDAARTACPAGWHLPTRAQWNDLIETVGARPAIALKSAEWEGSDYYGFSALPSGSRNTNNRFIDVNVRGSWWTATQSSSNAYYRSIQTGRDNVTEETGMKNNGFSVRCAEDWQ
jgi:uncharacterized protein (TIGR02145 family)